ncbi:hypothetical protein PNH38_01890 [Anoxybacillus rupiensis]|jgi:hypothetical protein|uniref:Uncharacterized protein n=1 Tax=Anoxybacteroides rupiense TaxID=311460 RepID=A0ABT5W281_9BACL|nr:hypothetical protein [Anoxybacillus rupiensis]
MQCYQWLLFLFVSVFDFSAIIRDIFELPFSWKMHDFAASIVLFMVPDNVVLVLGKEMEAHIAVPKIESFFRGSEISQGR